MPKIEIRLTINEVYNRRPGTPFIQHGLTAEERNERGWLNLVDVQPEVEVPSVIAELAVKTGLARRKGDS